MGGLVCIFEDAEASHKTYSAFHVYFRGIEIDRKLNDKVRQVERFI
jgi:hypothetical protein